MKCRYGMLLILSLLLPAAVAQNETKKGTPAPVSPWDLIRKEHDADHDGNVTAKEYGRGAERFQRLDTNRDGLLTEADFANLGRGQRGARGGQGARGTGARGEPARRRGQSLTAGLALTRILGLSPSSAVTTEAFKTLLIDMDGNHDLVLTPDELGAMFPAQLRPAVAETFDTDGNGEVAMAEMLTTFERLDTDKSGTLTEAEAEDDQPLPQARAERRREAPKVGVVAPDFTLPYKDGKTKATLSSFKGDRPVALIFGSYT